MESESFKFNFSDFFTHKFKKLPSPKEEIWVRKNVFAAIFIKSRHHNKVECHFIIWQSSGISKISIITKDPRPIKRKRLTCADQSIMQNMEIDVPMVWKLSWKIKLSSSSTLQWRKWNIFNETFQLQFD